MDAELDIENLIHRVHVISNLLVAHDGVGDGADSWITRLQAIIRHCQDKAAKIRTSLFFDLESSFFFFNDLVDVPIVSDEQYVVFLNGQIEDSGL